MTADSHVPVGMSQALLDCDMMQLSNVPFNTHSLGLEHQEVKWTINERRKEEI